MISARNSSCDIQTMNPELTWGDVSTSLELALHVSCHVHEPLDANLNTTFKQYHQASERRFQRWSNLLEYAAYHLSNINDENWLASWRLATSVTMEILFSEVLTRVWGTALAALEITDGRKHSHTDALKVFHFHSELTHRAKELLEKQSPRPSLELRNIDRLHRHLDRWSDLLTSPFYTHWHIDYFSVDPIRCHDYANLFFRSQTSPNMTQALLQMSLKQFLQTLDLLKAPSPRESRQIGNAILTSIPNTFRKTAL